MHKETVQDDGRRLQDPILTFKTVLGSLSHEVCMLQMFIPHKRRVEWRRRFREDRKAWEDRLGVGYHSKDQKGGVQEQRKFSFHRQTVWPFLCFTPGSLQRETGNSRETPGKDPPLPSRMTGMYCLAEQWG